MLSGFHLQHALAFGILLSLLGGSWIVIVLRINPRLFLRNYPTAIKDAAPPLTRQERVAGAILSVPLFALLIAIPLWSGFNLINGHSAGQGALFLDAFIVGMVFNAVDLLVIDILWLGLFPPRWVMIPGTEDVPYRPESAKHVRGFAVGSVVVVVIALTVSFVVPH